MTEISKMKVIRHLTNSDLKRTKQLLDEIDYLLRNQEEDLLKPNSDNAEYLKANLREINRIWGIEVKTKHG
jgi:hypothetical protein